MTQNHLIRFIPRRFGGFASNLHYLKICDFYFVWQVLSREPEVAG